MAIQLNGNDSGITTVASATVLLLLTGRIVLSEKGDNLLIMSMLDAFGAINSLALPITLFAGVTYLAFRLWRKKQIGKALKALLIIVTVLIGLSILLLLDILIGHLFPIR